MIELWWHTVREDLLRPECRPEVIQLIRESSLSDARKRAVYLRWLLEVGIRYHAEDLDEVIASRSCAASSAEEPR